MGREIEAVIFDQDGLMFDTERLAMRAWHEAGKEFGIEVGEDFLQGLRGMNARQSREAFLCRYGEREDYDEFREARRRFSYNWIGEHGVPEKRGLRELLSWLGEQGLPLAVATGSSGEWTERNLRLTGLRSYFQVLVDGGMVKAAKPDPEIFLTAAAKLDAPPSRCLVLEDSFNGIRAAAAGGFVPVMVPDLDEPDGEISALLEARCDSLLDVIGLFESGRLTVRTNGRTVCGERHS